MQMTAHIDARMNQRGIRKDLVELAMDIGEVDGDRFVLTRKVIDAEFDKMRRKMKALSDARKKGGVVVIADADALITAYRRNSFNPKLANRSER